MKEGVSPGCKHFLITFRKIHPFAVYSSMIFMYSHHRSHFRHFHHPEKKPCPPLAVTAPTPQVPQRQATADVLFVSGLACFGQIT